MGSLRLSGRCSRSRYTSKENRVFSYSSIQVHLATIGHRIALWPNGHTYARSEMTGRSPARADWRQQP
jgi:hypothetical protein